jgi:hypothetical protein
VSPFLHPSFFSCFCLFFGYVFEMLMIRPPGFDSIQLPRFPLLQCPRLLEVDRTASPAQIPLPTPSNGPHASQFPRLRRLLLSLLCSLVPADVSKTLSYLFVLLPLVLLGPFGHVSSSSDTLRSKPWTLVVISLLRSLSLLYLR